MSLSQTAAQYTATTALLDAGYSVIAVGRAMLALEQDRHDDQADDQDPSEWPSTHDEDIDGWVWTITPPELDDDAELFEPSQEDIEFLNTPPEPDWDEYARIAQWQDRLEAMNRYTDSDLAAAGLPVG